MELILVLALVGMLVSLVVSGLVGHNQRREFLESAGRLETLLRLCRASAAIEGRRMRLAFTQAGGGAPTPGVLWEPSPLAEPQRFVAYNLSAWGSCLPGPELRVIQCRRLDLAQEADEADRDALPRFDEITFYTDGSNDPALLELAPADEGDSLRYVIRLGEDQGSVVGFSLGATELAENRERIEQGDYAPSSGVAP